MLVITRKPCESFMIGGDIKISILEINGDKVKIGIDAPKEVKVLRSEVLETIKSNLQAVSAVTPGAIKLLDVIIKKPGSSEYKE